MKHILNLLSLVLVLCWATSCSDSENGFYDYIDDNSCAVVSLNVMEVMQNAGITFDSDGVHVPAYIKSFGQSVSSKETVDMLEKIKGIDPRKMLYVITDYEAASPVILIKIMDKGDLVHCIKDFGFEKTNGSDYEVYTKQQAVFAIDGDMLLVFGVSDSTPSDFVNSLKQAAEKAPVSSWKKSVLNSDETAVAMLNMARVYDADNELVEKAKKYEIENFDQIVNGTLVYKAKLKDNELKIESNTYAADGKKVKLPYSTGKVDKKLLKYTSSVDFAVALFSLPEDGKWKKTLINIINGECGDSGMAESVINLLNGKCMASFGYSSVMSLVNRGDCHYSLAIQAEKGKGHALYDQVRMLLNTNGIQYVESGNVMVVDFSQSAPSLYVVEDGDNVVISSVMDPAAEGGSNKFKAGDFDDDYAQLLVDIPAQSANITFISLPFGIEMEASSDSDGSETEIELTDCEGNFLENILKILANVI